MSEADTTQEMSTQETTTAADAVAGIVGEQGQQTQEQVGQAADQWMLTTGVSGEGDKPEWFKNDKYKTVEDQAKAYPELESKFGAFVGAPEEYTINISEELAENGVEFNADDPLVEEAFKFAKESNMSQEGFDNMLNLYGMVQAAQGDALESFKAEQIKMLGANAQSRIDNINAWAGKNLPADLMEGLQGMATSASAVETIEQLISMTRSGAMAPSDSTPATAHTAEDVQKMQFAKDDNGNRKIQTDPEFRKRYEQMRNEVFGTEPHRRMIG